MMVSLSALALAMAAPPVIRPPTVVPKQLAREYRPHPGFYYCAHFRASSAGTTVHRSDVVEGEILKSADGTIAALPGAFARYLATRSPGLGPIRAAEIRCFHHPAKRNLKALIERESGLGATPTTSGEKRPAKVTRLMPVTGFALPAELALKAWRPPEGSTIYRP